MNNKVLLLTLSFIFFSCFNASFVGAQESSKSEAYAQCLKEKGLTMYGAYWCPHCKDQKERFGEYLNEYISYVECTQERKLCRKKGIQGYPTLLLNDGEEIQQGTLEEVAREAGCKI